VATTPFASMKAAERSNSRMNPKRLAALGLFIALIAMAVVACGTVGGSAAPTSTPTAIATATAAGGSPAASVTPAPTPEPTPLEPAKPGADPGALMGALFTPIFQTMFVLLAALYSVTGNVVISIILMTLLIRLVTIKLSARQIRSQKRMQMLQPELKELQKELQRRYKGDRQAVYAAQQAFYKERGVSPTAGCLPSLLQMGLLFPMYWVIRDGLTNFDPSAMLRVFGVDLVPSLVCPSHHLATGLVDKSLPCINTVVAGINVGTPQVLFNIPILGFFTLGVSLLALGSAALQFIQSRMLMPPANENDPSANTQRQMMVLFPFISILYGGFLPAGLFVYWITTSLFSIVQQFFIVGWGSMFPLFGWNPGFAQNHTPRFPVTLPEPVLTGKSLAETRRQPEDRSVAAAHTVRPNTHRRASRRGRRR
jgi:YidC/Oxa1 family membrane protein insertase